MKLPKTSRRLFSKSEWKLLKTAAEPTLLKELTPKQKKLVTARLRKANTKYRDLSRRQSARAVKTKAYRASQTAARTNQKSQLVKKVCDSVF